MTQVSNGMAYRRGGSGPTVVLLHGIPGQGRAWDQVRAVLEGQFDVIVPDLIGFGDSDRPSTPTIDNVGPAAQASQLATLLDELGVRHATVVGHDFGAPVTVLLAADRPDLVAAVALLAGNTFPDTPIPFPLSLATGPILGGLFSRLLFSAPSLALMLRQGTGPGSVPPDEYLYLGDRGQRRSPRSSPAHSRGSPSCTRPSRRHSKTSKSPCSSGGASTIRSSRSQRANAPPQQRLLDCTSSTEPATSYRTSAQMKSPVRLRHSPPPSAHDGHGRCHGLPRSRSASSAVAVMPFAPAMLWAYRRAWSVWPFDSSRTDRRAGASPARLRTQTPVPSWSCRRACTT